MSQEAATVRPRRLRRPSLPVWLSRNPIIIKEMRGRMRSWRTLILISGYIILLGGFVGMIYLSFVSSSSNPSINARRELGRAIFFTVYILQLLVVCFTSPSLTAGAISSEREMQTYDLLRTTLLRASFMVLGKLLAAISFVLLLMFAALPLQSIAFLFGGITPTEMILGALVLIWTALLFGTIGVFFSSFVSKTRVSTALSQITVIMLVFGLPVMLLFLTIIFDARFNFIQNNLLPQVALVMIGWLIAVTSPLTTSILTEVILVEEQSLFFTTMSLSGGTQLPIPSPWLGFSILYPVLTLVLLWMTIRIVRRAER